MKIASASWIGVEAKKQGFPVLMRIRRITPDPSLPILFVVTWSYAEDHATRLPPRDFYSTLERFEKSAIDQIEHMRLGVFVASETGLGSIKYYFYTDSAEAMASKLDEVIPANENVEFASDLDNEWHEYGRFIKLVNS